MAVVLGVNSGFVTVAPVVDPAGSSLAMDTFQSVTKHTSPSGSVRITQIGWWCDNATEETNFEVGLYDEDVDTAGDLLYVERTNAKGVTSGWKTVNVDWAISENTNYYIAVQIDDTITSTNINRATSGGDGYDRTGGDTLSSPWAGGALLDADAMYAYYALVELEVGTNMQINIGDTWEDVDLIQINIGDVWKDVAEIQQNIGDAWKTVF